MTKDDIRQQFGTCANCRWWSWANEAKTLKLCLGDNGCAVTGDKFFCANWEKIK